MVANGRETKKPEARGNLPDSQAATPMTRSYFKTYRLRYHNVMNRQGKKEDEAWRGEDLAHSHGKRFVPIFPSRSPHGVEAAPGLRSGVVLRASCGSCGPAPSGASCPGGMAARAPVGGGSSTGKRLAPCSNCGGPSWPSSTTRRNSAGMNALSMGASSQRKRGA
jgi:hypothetical protein